ncbi:MAG: hypothetical protein KJ824_12075 [Alphaproteobacteria bacterium]|nr:hypothetical protein [Alphaproteobacteria bacterium]
MTDTRDDAADIAWLRTLAEEGSTRPMRGGGILMAAGLIYGVTSLAHWAVTSGLVDADPQAFSLIWLVATGLFLAVLTFLLTRKRGSNCVRTAVDRATGSVWSAVGWGIFALFTSVAVISMQVGEASLALLSLTPSIVMVFYGLGWAVTAAMTRSRPIGALAVASFVAAPLLALLTDQPAQYLAYAGCLFGLMAAPGFLLMRAARG